MSSLAFLRATVLTPLERVEDAALILRGGTIAWVGPRGAAPAGLLGSVPQAELPGDLILPGLIDLHLNGAGSIDLREADPPGVLSLARSLAEGGTTAFLPTLISSPHGCLLRALGALAQAAERQRQGPGKGARILGVHLEGPYLNPAMRGAHPAEALRPASRQEVEEYLRAAGATAHPG
ncbi:MAG: amidohydrolase family protein, partial [Nitrospinota bacterium]